MTKPHLQPACYSQNVEFSRGKFFNHFYCSYCNRGWQTPLGPTAEFVDGRLVSASDGGHPLSEAELDIRRANLAWMMNEYGQKERLL